MPSPLKLQDYRSSVQIDERPDVQFDGSWRELILPVLKELGSRVQDNTAFDEALFLLHGVLAPIDPFMLSDDLISKIESIAAGLNSLQHSVDPLTLAPIATQYQGAYPAGKRTCVWVGDITQLQADAIVNAANSEMLGCRAPNHVCIDNAIHSAAGPKLRNDCATIIDKQAAPESVGSAKITRAYALPSRFVLHTVGPQLRHGSRPTDLQRLQLANAYNSCLELAANIESIRSIAFCAISTGIFGYPKLDAAEIALKTVAEWFGKYPERFDLIVFNLYSDVDAAVYEELLDVW